MSPRDYGDYAQDMLDSIVDISEFIKGMDFQSFMKDKKTRNAVVHSLEILGEASKKIPASTKARYPGIPWREMAGMRDKISHEYFGIDYAIVWKVAVEKLPPLLKYTQKIASGFPKQEKL